jgi:hypothetical protein
MAFTEDGYFAVGGVQSPLSAATTNSLLQDSDPVLYNLLNYYTGIINLHIGARWNAEVTLAGRPDLVNLTVAEQVPFDPIPYFQENQYKFPLLAAYRKSEKYEFKSAGWYHTISTLNIMWVLPPITAGQAERLNPFRVHVVRTLVDRTLEGFDTNYNAGEQFWKESGLEKIGIQSTSYGNIPDVASDLYLPTALIECELVERRMNPTTNGNFAPLEGVENDIEEAD